MNNENSIAAKVKARVADKFDNEYEVYYALEGEHGVGKGSSYEKLLDTLGLKFVADNSESEYNSYGDSYVEHDIIYEDIETGKFVALRGNYQSYDGTEWEGFFDVKKVEKTIEVWEKIF